MRVMSNGFTGRANAVFTVAGTPSNDAHCSLSLRIHTPIVLPDLQELACVRPTNESRLVVGASLLCEVFTTRRLVFPPS
jgi:hypothetical protein